MICAATDRGFYKEVNIFMSVSKYQCTRDKSFIARKPEVHYKIFS